MSSKKPQPRTPWWHGGRLVRCSCGNRLASEVVVDELVVNLMCHRYDAGPTFEEAFCQSEGHLVAWSTWHTTTSSEAHYPIGNVPPADRDYSVPSVLYAPNLDDRERGRWQVECPSCRRVHTGTTLDLVERLRAAESGASVRLGTR